MTPCGLHLRALLMALILYGCSGDYPVISPIHPCQDGGRCGGVCVDLTSDISHCGGCGTRCTVTPGRSQVAACVTGRCAAVCASGRGDCNSNASDGCETPLDTVRNCGGCGMVCPVAAGATPECVNGRCQLRCSNGMLDCDQNPANGCESDPRTSVTNCGACGTACVFPNATPTCVVGVCTLGPCNGVFGNCDGNMTNGCETLLTTTNNCGACARLCSYPRATAVCRDQVCALDSCVGNFMDCNRNPLADGCETDTQSSISSCGGCGVVCPEVANATRQCTMGRCGFTCLRDYADCNSRAADGCEENLLMSAAHCGACTVNCNSLPQTQGIVCRAGACVITACRPAYADCNGVAADGCEVALRTPTNCARCGDQCDGGTMCRPGDADGGSLCSL